MHKGPMRWLHYFFLLLFFILCVCLRIFAKWVTVAVQQNKDSELWGYTQSLTTLALKDSLFPKKKDDLIVLPQQIM